MTFQVLGSAMYAIIKIQKSLLIIGYVLLIQFMMLHSENTGQSIYQNENDFLRKFRMQLLCVMIS